MFARVIKGKAKEYVAIVRGFRDEQGKVRQRTVYSLGPVTDETKESTLQIARNIIASSKGGEIVASAEDIQEVARKNWGAPAVIEKLYEKFDLEALITKSKTELALKLMFINQFLQPKSKLSAWQQRSLYEGYDKVELHDLYRALDELHCSSGEIKEHILRQQKNSVNLWMFCFLT